MTTFVSRDSYDGVLDDFCDVWHERPLRTPCNGRVCWVVGASGIGFVENLPVQEAEKKYRTVPNTDRELIVIT